MTSTSQDVPPRGSRPDDPPSLSRIRATLEGCLPAVLGVAVAMTVTSTYLQVVHPFLAHDDWDTLLPVTEAERSVQRGRLVAEGRWINYAWWRTVGQLLTPVSATVLYVAGYAAFVVHTGRRLAPGWRGALVAGALFVSPMAALLAAWPAVLGPSMLVLAVSTWTLPLCRHRVVPLLVWMGLTTGLAALTYQPVALLMLLVLLLEEMHRSVRRLAGLVIAFCGLWVAAVLVMFTLNWWGFGVFGLKPQAWRLPNPARGIDDVVENLGRTGRHFRDVAVTMPWPLVVGLVAVAFCLARPTLRKQAVVLLLGLVVAAGLESVGTVVGGFLVPFRSSGWIWVGLVVAISWLAQGGRKGWTVLSVAAMAAVAVDGAVFWHDVMTQRQATLADYDRLDRRLGSLLASHPQARVLVVGTAEDWKDSTYAAGATYLRGRTLHQYGVRATFCRLPTCTAPVDPRAFGQQVLVRDDTIVAVPVTAAPGPRKRG